MVDEMNKKALIISILAMIFVTFMFVLLFIKPLYFIIMLMICGILTVGFFVYCLIDDKENNVV